MEKVRIKLCYPNCLTVPSHGQQGTLFFYGLMRFPFVYLSTLQMLLKKMLQSSIPEELLDL